MTAWDTPYTAEELAALPPRRPFDELIREYAARTGSPLIRATPTPKARAAALIGTIRGNRWR